MAVQQILPGVYMIPAGISNAFLIESPDGCTLIDTGVIKGAEKILRALAELKKAPSDVRSILVTHAHPDHIGGLAQLQRATGAQTYIHHADATIARTGTGFRPLHAAPGLLKKIMIALVRATTANVPPSTIDHEVADGEILPIAGGITAIHTPGHCAGHLAFFWPQHGGVMFAGDACMNSFGLDWTIGYEDIAEGEHSLQKLGGWSFETACFGHGKPILRGAGAAIRSKWPA